jgi:hypothetical protein
MAGNWANILKTQIRNTILENVCYKSVQGKSFWTQEMLQNALVRPAIFFFIIFTITVFSFWFSTWCDSSPWNVSVLQSWQLWQRKWFLNLYTDILFHDYNVSEHICSKFLSELYQRWFTIHQETAEITFSWKWLYVRSSSDVTSSLDESLRSPTSQSRKSTK